MCVLYIFMKCEMLLLELSIRESHTLTLCCLAFWQTFKFLLFSHFPSSQDHRALTLLLHLLHLITTQLVHLPLWCTHSLQVRQYLFSCRVTFKSKIHSHVHTQKHCACSLGLLVCGYVSAIHSWWQSCEIHVHDSKHFKRLELSGGVITQNQTHGTTPRSANLITWPVSEVGTLKPSCCVVGFVGMLSHHGSRPWYMWMVPAPQSQAVHSLLGQAKWLCRQLENAQVWLLTYSSLVSREHLLCAKCCMCRGLTREPGTSPARGLIA